MISVTFFSGLAVAAGCLPVASWASAPATLTVREKKHKKATRVPGTALVIDKITRSCAKVRLLSERREVKVPVMSLADPQILSNPESGLLTSALVPCLLARTATERILVFGPKSVLFLMPEKVRQ
ncbi:hypothetical protein [Mesorhizobium muleiense]|uniref:hypothetical protein n=1 Tax=Mesorhizobium muleiense TaxID=1004279 RepID=UPI001F2EA75A|nr:hypothetical protein [Mesorhizobium muleiense]MCF6113498.1 hypothetical protein [Mesorhizobium muleiense]